MAGKPKPLVPPLKKGHTTLRKAGKPTHVGSTPTPKPFCVATGTPNQMRDPVRYATEQAAKMAAIDFFNSYMPMMERINHSAVAELDACISEIQKLPVLIPTRREVSRVIDDYSGLALMVQLWREGS